MVCVIRVVVIAVTRKSLVTQNVQPVTDPRIPGSKFSELVTFSFLKHRNGLHPWRYVVHLELG